MSVPPEYTDAYNDLILFRTKLLTDLVKERVVASLDAEHDGMVKFGNLINTLSITPYLIGKMRENALALKIGDKDLGEGTNETVTVKYIGDKGLYPLQPPYSVPQRFLPQVDIYQYTPVLPVNLKELTDISVQMSMFIIQAENDDFLEFPDAENSRYDYYNFYPQQQYRGGFEMEADNICGIKYVRGVYTRFMRALHRSSDGTQKTSYVNVFVDCETEGFDGLGLPYTVVAYIPPDISTPKIVAIMVGKRVPQDDFGVYNVFMTAMRDVGVSYCCKTIDWFIDEEVVWVNSFNLTRTVNNADMGYTDPPSGDYIHDAGYGLIDTAYPLGGYSFDHWELDGVDVGSVNPYYWFIHKPCELKAVFV